MLRELVVEGLGVIDRAELSLEPGSTALTGETGAGKTLVVAALGLLLGDRAEKTLVRTGARAARVEGRFEVAADHPVVALLSGMGVLEETKDATVDIVVSRTIAGEGSGSKARVNGRLVTVADLARAGALLVEIAGQNQHQRVAGSDPQRRMLDAFAGDAALRLAHEVEMEVRAMRSAATELDTLRAEERNRAREIDVLGYEIGEIEGIEPREGESDDLSAAAARLQHAERIASDLARASDLIRRDGGVEELLSAAEDAVRDAAEADESLAPWAARLEALRIEAADAAAELSDRVVEPDQRLLEETRERLDELARLRRKYGDTETEVLAHLARSRTRLEQLRGGSADAERLTAERDAAEARAAEAAAELSRIRAAAAQRLTAAVEAGLADLALEGSRFEVAIEPCTLFEGGAERIAFLFSANPGEALRPLSKVASGGEMSRLALALHLLIRGSGAPTMVFDEVDAGVGGAAARSVGRALADVARRGETQVLVVTHLPQVAAFADHHLSVRKATSGGVTSADVAVVEEEERIEELSRMLAGLPDSAIARDHARELLELAAEGASAA